jgi:hypothetical protein
MRCNKNEQYAFHSTPFPCETEGFTNMAFHWLHEPCQPAILLRTGYECNPQILKNYTNK